MGAKDPKIIRSAKRERLKTVKGMYSNVQMVIIIGWQIAEYYLSTFHPS
jgi:hypothetical protein